ncbi:MAG: hypothetical protein HY897_02200 [Deltaproteobacteria bacterium]|nr:hypothetical protein [Deltaproteobacteria bacterium]
MSPAFKGVISFEPSVDSRTCQPTDAEKAEEFHQLGLTHMEGEAMPATYSLGVACLKRAASLGHPGSAL